MQIAGGIIVILAFAAIIKKYETRMVLFGAGLLMCIIGGVPDMAITTFSKQMVHNSLVPTICTVMGFSYVMKLTECDRHLVSSISGVLKKSKIFLIPLAFLLTWWINIAIPSAAGCAAAVGSILILPWPPAWCWQEPGAAPSARVLHTIPLWLIWPVWM